MKYLDEYRDGDQTRRYADRIRQLVTRPWTLMEVCGGQTHSIVRFGIDQLLPDSITLLHGPGCPVCVTPIEIIDQALVLAERPDVIFCSFGDMLRVPGSRADLLSVKAAGGDVRIVYSPLDALKIAELNSDREVIFFAVGFETTAPANAMAAYQAVQRNVRNFSLLVSQVRVPPALEFLLSSPDCRVNGFLAAGHVCTVMGVDEYHDIAGRYQVPLVVTGFEPVDLMEGIVRCIAQLESGRHEVEIAYSRAVRVEGNPEAQRMIARVFRTVPRTWRGIGEVPESGLDLREEYAALDAVRKFSPQTLPPAEPSECLSGLVLQGLIKPFECPAFGVRCTPVSPLGATMVSSEGACAAYYEYRRTGAVGISR